MFPSAVDLALYARQVVSESDALAKRFPPAIGAQLETRSAA